MLNISINKQKLKKFIQNPPIFFRDYLNKHYPQSYTELKVNEITEFAFASSLAENYIHTAESMAIDVVYTWVDNTDILWQQKYQSFKENYSQNNIGRFAIDDARFSNHNELYYSVKSIRKYLPWVRNIYIVTDEQQPSWLAEFNNIYIIDHKQIVDEAYLPTFNSHVIEAFLYKIPNLSENFIYFNDDVFVAKSLNKEHFFSANNLASLFISAKNLQEMQNRGVSTPTLSASLSSLNLLNQIFSLRITNSLVHTYYPLKKSSYQQVWQLFDKEIRAFLLNKFRGNNDLNLATFLVPWFMYGNAQATERIDVCYYFNIRSPTALTYYQKLLALKDTEFCPHSFCANDFNTENKNQLLDYQKKLLTMLDKYYH